MKKLLFLALTFLITTGIAAQTETKPELPKDPKAILDMARPFYDYNSADLKPWHMKFDYQLYDGHEQPVSIGTFEYWWGAPDLSRSSWTRDTSTFSEWTEPGKKRYQYYSGEKFNMFEHRIKEILLDPLPSDNELDPQKADLALDSFKSSKSKLPCVEVLPKMNMFGSHSGIPLGLFPTYCFDTRIPVLLVTSTYGGLTISLGQIIERQNRYLPKSLSIFENQKKVLTATISQVNSINADDPAFKPITNAQNVPGERITIPGGVMAGKVLYKEAPRYPEDAKQQRISGTVVVHAVIGFDGNVHNLSVVSAPYPSLAASALTAVSKWRYSPYLLNGVPVEVDTTVNVVYSLGN